VDRTFTTQFGGLGFGLADDRVWEMVSPPNKHGAKLIRISEVHFQASLDGAALAYPSRLSIEEDPEGNRILEPSTSLARRNADGSWRSKDITPPNDRVTPLTIGNGGEYKLFKPDLSAALVEPRSGTSLSPEASERTPYLRENAEPPVYTPLVTGKEPYANVPPGTEFGGGERPIGFVTTIGASSDFRHFALRSDVPLVENAPSSGQTVYEWSEGQIEPVSVLPVDEGGEIVEAHFVGSGEGSVRGALSEGGSRVFWSTGTYGSTTGLYVRDTEAGESGRLDVKQTGASGVGTARPVFQGASADGTVVFFTDSRQLSADASSNGFDLYRCELPLGSIASGCATLTNISVPIAAGENAKVLGIAPAINEDGTRVYFVAQGVLDDEANALGDGAVSGQPNLYLWQQGDGVRFIATLSDEDRSDWGGSLLSPNSIEAQLTAVASPNARYLAFMSQRSLTGYDNRDGESGEAAQEVFRYDAVTGDLGCASCNPSRSRPDAPVRATTAPLIDPWDLWLGQRAAATLPEAVSTYTTGISLYRPRSVLDNGRVFFNAIDPLVSADSNGQWDVYQYEPTGVGDCLVSSGGSSTSRAAGGCVSLLSSGTAVDEAGFLDAGETGDDAFFLTSARLSVLDEDLEVDIYDARVGGVPATRSPISECLGDACQPMAKVPIDPTPASAGFKGTGNLRPVARKRCPRSKRAVRRHGRVRCVSRKHHRSSDGKKKHREAKGERGLLR
jgi:hypothetical protein